MTVYQMNFDHICIQLSSMKVNKNFDSLSIIVRTVKSRKYNRPQSVSTKSIVITGLIIIMRLFN